MRVLVTGSRYYEDRGKVYEVLDAIFPPITILIHGACHLGGADILAEDWAKSAQIDYVGFPARWEKDGYPQAGGIRNQRMIDVAHPELAVAFGGLGNGIKGGTNDMVRRIKKAGIELIEVDREQS